MCKIGYSLARPITISLFTSKATGYPGSPGAFPFAMAFVSPVSLILLLAYGSILEKRGPRGALERTTLYCSSAILGSAAAVEIAQRTNAILWKTSIPVVKLISGPLFVFRESYVQLLTRCVQNRIVSWIKSVLVYAVKNLRTTLSSTHIFLFRNKANIGVSWRAC